MWPYAPGVHAENPAQHTAWSGTDNCYRDNAQRNAATLAGLLDEIGADPVPAPGAQTS